MFVSDLVIELVIANEGPRLKFLGDHADGSLASSSTMSTSVGCITNRRLPREIPAYIANDLPHIAVSP